MSSNDLNNQDDLVLRLAEGDEKAFASVYSQFYERLYYFARRFVPETDAEDVTADSFIKLLNRKEKFESLESISAFLHVTIRNHCIDILRRRLTKEQKEVELLQMLENSSEEDLFLEQVKIELLQLIYCEVEKLPHKMKEIFLLSYLEGLKPAEIAERLHITTKTVSNQKLNAIKLLKAVLNQHSLQVGLLLLLQLRK